jgi:hypothetical protein
MSRFAISFWKARARNSGWLQHRDPPNPGLRSWTGASRRALPQWWRCRRNGSIYLGTGGGFIGGVHEPIRTTAKQMVSAAAEYQHQMNRTSTFPLPKRGEVIFYVLTDAGVFTGRASQEELASGHHTFSKPGNAAQAVITAYRVVQPNQQR